jgi:Tol biopolymer transport system component
MKSSTQRVWRLRLSAMIAVGVAALAAGLLVLMWSKEEPVRAAFPGGNGKIAFITDRGSSWDIYRMNPDGSLQQNVVLSLGADRDPDYSANGKNIALESSRDGYGADIYRMTSTGTLQTRLTFAHDRDNLYTSNGTAADIQPAWSPAGTKIAFSSDRGANQDIYTMNTNGTGVQRLTTDPAQESDPAWSPDGNNIAFSTNRDGNWNIYRMTSTGALQTRLTTSSAFDMDPSWQPLP